MEAIAWYRGWKCWFRQALDIAMSNIDHFVTVSFDKDCLGGVREALIVKVVIFNKIL